MCYDSHRERLVNAQKLFSQLPAHYTDLRWTALDAYLLSRCTDLQAALDMPRDQLLSTLALVRAGVEYGSRRWSLDALLDGDDGADLAAQNEKLAKRLMDDVYRLSATLTKGAWLSRFRTRVSTFPDSRVRRLCRRRVSDVLDYAQGGLWRASSG